MTTFCTKMQSFCFKAKHAPIARKRPAPKSQFCPHVGDRDIFVLNKQFNNMTAELDPQCFSLDLHNTKLMPSHNCMPQGTIKFTEYWKAHRRNFLMFLQANKTLLETWYTSKHLTQSWESMYGRITGKYGYKCAPGSMQLCKKVRVFEGQSLPMNTLCR
jgi:hypothetical protein